MKILFSSGELSGDEHLANLLKNFRKLYPDAVFRGMAGPKTRKEGFETELELEKYASVMGFVDVFRKGLTIVKAIDWFKKSIQQWKPDLIILVDYPDFNLKLARIACQNRIKTFYFIAPKLWAWRASRISKIRQFVDYMALILPFEKNFYNSLGYDKCCYVGHPFSGVLKKDDSTEVEQHKKNLFFSENSLNPNAPTLALFPGSRQGELDKHLEPALETIKILSSRINNLQILLSGADTLSSYLKNKKIDLAGLNFKIIYGKNLEILRFSDVGLIKSGTSNLQAAFLGLPFIMFYKSNLLTELIVKNFVRIKQYSLVNIIELDSVDEFVIDTFDIQKMADRLEELFVNQAARDKAVSKLNIVQSKLGQFDNLDIFKGTSCAYQRAAIMASQLIKGR